MKLPEKQKLMHKDFFDRCEYAIESGLFLNHDEIYELKSEKVGEKTVFTLCKAFE